MALKTIKVTVKLLITLIYGKALTDHSVLKSHCFMCFQTVLMVGREPTVTTNAPRIAKYVTGTTLKTVLVARMVSMEISAMILVLLTAKEVCANLMETASLAKMAFMETLVMLHAHLIANLRNVKSLLGNALVAKMVSMDTLVMTHAQLTAKPSSVTYLLDLASVVKSVSIEIPVMSHAHLNVIINNVRCFLVLA